VIEVTCGTCEQKEEKGLSVFERYLTVWVLLCIGVGIVLGRALPDLAGDLDRMSVYQVSLPIAICLFFMMYPIMVKIDFSQVMRAARTPKPVGLTLVLNWVIKPFTMFAIATFFLGYVFRPWITGVEVLSDGTEVELWRSYISGAILLGIAPCTAMVLMWSYLAKGNDGLTLVMVAVNSLIMLVLYAPLGGFLLGVNAMPIPWETIVLSVLVYVGLPLVTGYLSRRWLIDRYGEEWFSDRFVKYLTPVAITALLVTLVVLFILKGEVIVDNPGHIAMIAVPLFIQTILIFTLGYFTARTMRLRYADAAPAAMIGASNHFEVAIATSAVLFGLSSGAALATVVGVLIEVPVMLMLVRICLRTQHWFPVEDGDEGDGKEGSSPSATTG
jgi:ACR3 family arsenite transporter